MKPCDAWGDSLVDLQYGLLDPQQERACRDHLDRCAACARRAAVLQRLEAALSAEPALPRERDVDWDAFARATARRALGRRARLLALLRPLAATPAARTAWAGAAAALVVVAGLGVMSRGPGAPPAGPATAGAAEVMMPQDNLDHLSVNLARNNTARYLNETRAVLVTLLDVNIPCDAEKVDISLERAKAVELLRRQRLIAAELRRMPLSRAEGVCNDLEGLLLEIASLGDCTRDEEIRTLRDAVEKRQILVRMELLSQELARGGARA